MIYIKNVDTGNQIEAGCLLSSEDTMQTKTEIKFSFEIKEEEKEALRRMKFLEELTRPPSEFQKRPPYVELIQPEGDGGVEEMKVRGVMKHAYFRKVSDSFYKISCTLFKLDPAKYGQI